MGEAEVVVHSFLEELGFVFPGDPFFVDDTFWLVFENVVWVQDQELALVEFPGIVDPKDSVSVLPSPVHDWSTHRLEMLFEEVYLLHNILPILQEDDLALDPDILVD